MPISPARAARRPARAASAVVLAAAAFAWGASVACGDDPDGPAAGATAASRTGASRADATDAAGARDAPDDTFPDGTSAGFPRSVTGADGAELSLPSPPRRVVPASAGLVDLACALLPPERLAGLPGQALAYSSLRDASSPYLQRPRFEVYAAEPVLALQPDLVLADAWQSAETTERLRAAGVPVLVLGRFERLEQAGEALRLLARALGTGRACGDVLDDLRARAQALVDGGAHRRGWRALSYVNGGTGGWVAGAGTTPDEWITLTGMTNAGAGFEGHARCSFEQLLELDPDLIVVSGRAAYDDMAGTAGLLRRERVLAGLSAVRRDRIVVLEAWLYNTLGLHSVLAAEALAGQADAVMGAGPGGGGAR
jgi:iron complex transport system substrate-binding protein